MPAGITRHPRFVEISGATINGFYRGALHFYGHVHARMLDTDRRIDVGADNWDYAPARLEAVLTRMRAA